MVTLTLTDEQADILYDAISEHFMSIDDDSVQQVLGSIEFALHDACVAAAKVGA